MNPPRGKSYNKHPKSGIGVFAGFGVLTRVTLREFNGYVVCGKSARYGLMREVM